jgi:hypothetical protein
VEAVRDNDELRDRGRNDGEHVGERLDAYRTGELDAEARLRVEAHLEACGRCREELAALGPWAAAIERGYEARRAQATALEPDWAAQRSEIVARTSGHNVAEGRSFGRWAPQVALVALAALIVGIVWRENPREDVLQRAPSAQSTEEAEERSDASDAAVGAGRDQAAALEGDAAAEMPAAPVAPPAAVPELGRTQARQARQAELEKQAIPEAEEGRAENQGALADRAAEPTLAAPLADVERFERQARAALRARDTTAARRALALWIDTLRAAGDTLGAAARIGGEQALLADSLRELLERPE